MHFGSDVLCIFLIWANHVEFPETKNNAQRSVAPIGPILMSRTPLWAHFVTKKDNLFFAIGANLNHALATYKVRLWQLKRRLYMRNLLEIIVFPQEWPDLAQKKKEYASTWLIQNLERCQLCWKVSKHQTCKHLQYLPIHQMKHLCFYLETIYFARVAVNIILLVHEKTWT